MLQVIEVAHKLQEDHEASVAAFAVSRHIWAAIQFERVYPEQVVEMEQAASQSRRKVCFWKNLAFYNFHRSLSRIVVETTTDHEGVRAWSFDGQV